MVFNRVCEQTRVYLIPEDLRLVPEKVNTNVTCVCQCNISLVWKGILWVGKAPSSCCFSPIRHQSTHRYRPSLPIPPLPPLPGTPSGDTDKGSCRAMIQKRISESCEGKSQIQPLWPVCVSRRGGKAWTGLDYAIIHVPAGRGQLKQKGCFFFF